MYTLTLNDALSRIPTRPADAHKGTFGTLLSFCGSSYFRGAAVLSSLGALRTGVGILRLASCESVISAVAASVPEATFIPLDAGDDGFVRASEADVCGILSSCRATAVLCGCGLGNTESCGTLVRALCENVRVPLILDADALNILSGSPDILKNVSSPVTITPHIGEFARLTGLSASDIKRLPEKCASAFASSYNCTVVLKDSDTVVAAPDGDVLVSRFGNPGLSRGGSGDILAGMIASFAAQGLSGTDAAVCGVVLHGAAADRCAGRLSMTGMLPHDILTDLCDIFLERK